MIRFNYPEMLLLLLPLLYPAWRLCRRRGVTGVLRGALILLGVLALAAPQIRMHRHGTDVVVLVDRSRSMPEGSDSRALEIISFLSDMRGTADRIGVVTFGDNAAIEAIPRPSGRLDNFIKSVGPNGSDLAAGLRSALNLFPADASGRVLVVSDGEYNGPDPLPAAAACAAHGIAADYRLLRRPRAADVAVEAIQLPRSVNEMDPFQFSCWVYAERGCDAEFELFRDGRRLRSDKCKLLAGRNRLFFRDVLATAGSARYVLRVKTRGDPIRENNRASAVLRVVGRPGILVVNPQGKPDNLARALDSAKVALRVIPGGSAPLTPAELLGYKAVVLENLPASDLGHDRMAALKNYVKFGGGGLLVTGGKSSFGTGGYFRSPLDPILPVSMELRQEHRKLAIAMVFVLDRSGSMAMEAQGGKTKMDLANLGTCAAVQLMTPYDQVGVIAVDSTAHIMQPLTPVSAPGAITSRIRQIQAMGGGIFIYEGLKAAAAMIAGAEKVATRHIVIFADAADSEQPGDYKNLVAKLARAGVTVSVIGLGTKSDADAAFLMDIAARGKGRIFFTN